MKTFTTFLLALVLAGCNSAQQQTQPPLTDYRFLGFLDAESQTFGQKNPAADPHLAGVPAVTAVEEIGFAEYEAYHQGSRITHEETCAGWIYISIDESRDVPFADGKSAMISVCRRLKTRIR